MIKKMPLILFCMAWIVSCKSDTSSTSLEKMNCDDFIQKVAASDTMSVSASVIVSNLKKIVDIETETKNKLIASYSADTKNNIAYSKEFCHNYNGLLDILNAEDKNRRNNNDLSPEQRQSAEKNYTSTLKSLQELLLKGIRNEIGGDNNIKDTQNVAIQNDTFSAINQAEESLNGSNNQYKEEGKNVKKTHQTSKFNNLNSIKRAPAPIIESDEKLYYFSKVNIGFQIESATINGKSISIEKGSVSPYAKKGDILIFYGDGKEKVIKID